MQIQLTTDDLRPIVESVVADLLDRFGVGDRIAYSEKEAAALIGQRSHVLRDARLRGEIEASKVGRGYLYSRGDLLEFLKRRKAGGDE